MSEVQDRIVVITGGSSGIGAACGELFAKNDAIVVLVARDSDELAVVANNISAMGRVHTYNCDVSNEAQVRQTFTGIRSDLGRIDVLINSAGYAGKEYLVHEMPSEDYRLVMSTNVDGTFFCCRESLPMMIEQESGLIVNISSGGGKEGFAYFSHYCASKAAVIAFTQSLRSEVRQYGIRVTCLIPGPTRTPMQESALNPALKQMDPRTVALSILGCALLPPDGLFEEIVVRPS